MIARVGHGVTSAADGDERCRFLFTSLWDGFEAIRAFAGPDIERAVYYPADRQYLLAMPPPVQHFEVHAFPEHP